MYVDADFIIRLATIMGAFGALGTVLYKSFRWMEQQKMQEAEIENIPFRGVKGTTGTQASFMELFGNDEEKVKKYAEQYSVPAYYTDYNEMLKFLRENPSIKTVLVEKTDRLYRNFKDYVTLEDYDLEVHLVKEGSIISKNSKSAALKFCSNVILPTVPPVEL